MCSPYERTLQTSLLTLDRTLEKEIVNVCYNVYLIFQIIGNSEF